MNANRQIFRNQRPTPAARLGRVAWVYSDNLNTGAFSLVLKHLPKQSKTSVVRRMGQMSIAVHKAERKIFNRYQVILDDKSAAKLMQIIGTLISNLLMQVSNMLVGFTLAFAPLDLPGSMALKTAQFSKVRSQPAGVFNQLPDRKGSETFQTYIHANLIARLSEAFLWIGQLQHQANIPAAIAPFDHSVFDVRLNRNCPVIAQPDFAHVLNVKRFAPVFILAQFTTIPIGVLDAFEAITALIARKSRRLPSFYSAKEGRKCFVQAAQQLLNTASIQLAEGFWVVMAYISKVRPLRIVAHPFARFLIGGDPLFEGSVVDPPGLPQLKIQRLHLFLIRAKEVFVSADHRTIILLVAQPLHYSCSQKGERAASSVA